MKKVQETVVTYQQRIKDLENSIVDLESQPPIFVPQPPEIKVVEKYLNEREEKQTFTKHIRESKEIKIAARSSTFKEEAINRNMQSVKFGANKWRS